MSNPKCVVTTRTTALTSVTHPNFMLRFSDLADVETVCKEDEEQRAGRMIDWISSRVSAKCSRWIEDVQKIGEENLKDGRTPWWDELKRCTEGDNTPSRMEGWNHPVASKFVLPTRESFF